MNADMNLHHIARLLQNMWPIFSIIFMILVLRLNTALSVLATLVVLFIRSRFSSRETISLLKKAVDGNMLLMVITLLAFGLYIIMSSLAL